MKGPMKHRDTEITEKSLSALLCVLRVSVVRLV